MNKDYVFYANIILGFLSGLLIAIPIAISLNYPALGLLAIIFCAGFGAYSGYKKNNSRAFMYMCLAVVCILSTLISFSMT